MANFESAHVEPLPPELDVKEDMDAWLFRNFSLLKNSVFVKGIETNIITVQNSVVETTIIELEIPPYGLHVGESFIWETAGAYSNASSADDFTLRMYLNATLIHTMPRTGGNVTDAGWNNRYLVSVITEGATGELVEQAILRNEDKSRVFGHTSSVSVNTTIANTFKLTVQWNNAKSGNIFVAQQNHILIMHGHGD